MQEREKLVVTCLDAGRSLVIGQQSVKLCANIGVSKYLITLTTNEHAQIVYVCVCDGFWSACVLDKDEGCADWLKKKKVVI